MKQCRPALLSLAPALKEGGILLGGTAASRARRGWNHPVAIRRSFHRYPGQQPTLPGAWQLHVGHGEGLLT